MRLYFYENHIGGIYTSEYPLDDNYLYCKQCECYDTEIGCFNSAIDGLKGMSNHIEIRGSGSYGLEYILDQLKCFEDCPSYDEAEKILLQQEIDSMLKGETTITVKLEDGNFYTGYLVSCNYSEAINDYVLRFKVESTNKFCVITLEDYYEEIAEYGLDLTKEQPN